MENIKGEITPIDGRYRRQTNILVNYFSELALARYRIKVEISYLNYLSRYKIIRLTNTEVNLINKLAEKFDQIEFERVKEIEKTINHDVKAVEYYLGNKFEKNNLKKIIPLLKRQSGKQV